MYSPGKAVKLREEKGVILLEIVFDLLGSILFHSSYNTNNILNLFIKSGVTTPLRSVKPGLLTF